MSDLSLTDLDGRSWALQEMAWALNETMNGVVAGIISEEEVATVACALFQSRVFDRAHAMYEADTT